MEFDYLFSIAWPYPDEERQRVLYSFKLQNFIWVLKQFDDSDEGRIVKNQIHTQKLQQMQQVMLSSY
jgi:dolichyl-phosphate-mannose--protein O-mannosyl transferase